MIKSNMIPGIAALAFVVSVIWLLTLAWSDPLAVINSAAANDKTSYALSIRSACLEGPQPVHSICLHQAGKPVNRARRIHNIGTLNTAAP